MADRFLIAPFNSGLKNDVKPFMIPDNAFAELKNAYVFRGRVRKRFGSELSGNGATTNLEQTLFSKCAIPLATACTRIQIGTTDGSGDLTSTKVPGTDYRIGQKFMIGSVIFTVTALGTPSTMTASGGSTTVRTFDTTTGNVIFAGADTNTAVYYYPYGFGGTTDGAGYVEGLVPGIIWKVGQQFSIGSVVFTVVTATAGDQQMLRTDYSGTGPIESATFDTSSGLFKISIAAAPAQNVYFYPCDPIMGLWQYETTPVNNQVAFAFDTQFIYYFNAGRWKWIGPAPGYRFHGADDEFFWVANYQGTLADDTAMFVTNFNVVNPTRAADRLDDPMWYWDGSTWTQFAPTLVTSSSKKLISARIILPFHRHLVALDTIEQVGGNNSRYKNRARWCQDGSPLDPYAWLEPNQVNYQGGGWADAATQEGIISAEYIKDRLIVYFERSTWELAYTGNEIEPFIWIKLNSELGSESTYSSVPFDKIVLSVSSNGITGCNGANVERVDDDIPDYVFQFSNDNSGTARVHGIRDYKAEMVYWSAPVDRKCTYSYFPNTILAYNYKNGSWAEFDDAFTAFGYFEQSVDKTWAEMNIPWEECNFTWNAYVSLAKERLIIAGNTQGSIVILKPELTSNARNMTITNFSYDALTNTVTITSPDHILLPGDFVRFYDLGGVTLDSTENGIHKVITATKDTITLTDCKIVRAIYTGGGAMSRVSKISIKSKEWNFYLKDGRNFLVNKMDFYVTRNSGTYVTDFLLNSSSDGMANDAIGNDVAQGDYKIFLGGKVGLEETQERLWRGQYFQAEGNCIQLWIYPDDDDMKLPATAFSGLEIHAIMIHARPTSLVMEVMSNE